MVSFIYKSLLTLVAMVVLLGCAAATAFSAVPGSSTGASSLYAQAPTAVPLTPDPGATGAPNAPLSLSDWTMYHHDATRTGYLPDFPDPRQLSVVWNTRLDGAVYAEPLVVGTHVIVATEGDSIYSLDASTGQIEWRTNVGTPVPHSDLPCGNIDPLGITGTPVYDPASGLIFAVAEVTGPSHVLVGIDALSGVVRLRRPADPQGMEPVAHQQRAALALFRGLVYIAYGGLFGDCGNYHGWVVASRTDGSGPLMAYQVPTGREGGIWAPPGPAIDAAGHIFVSVGNGSETVGDWDHSDSVLRLSSTLQMEDGFAPDRWRQDNLTDADLGSLGPVLLPGSLVFIMGKAGIGYVLHADALGGIAGQIQSKSICHAYGGAAAVGSTIFVPCNEGVQQVQVGPEGGLNVGWSARGVPGSPVVGGQTVYSLDRNGTLHALDMRTGQPRATVSVGATSRFSTPALAQGKVFIGAMSGIVAVAIQ